MAAAPPPTPELHLPDLPEVTVNLAALRRPAAEPGTAAATATAAPRAALSWGYRLQQALTAYLPLGLMALLAVGTWWLVRHTPGAAPPPAAAAPRKEPDYTMSGFSVSRFNAEGRLVLRISGDQLRHYPDTDRMEIEGVKIQAIAPDGRITDASARRALANGDGSEIQLLGGAQVLAPLADGDVLEVQGEFLHAFTRFERLRSHLPVRVRRGGSDIRAGGMDYEHPSGVLQLAGPVRATLLPRRPAPPVTTGATPATSPTATKDAAR